MPNTFNTGPMGLLSSSQSAAGYHRAPAAGQSRGNGIIIKKGSPCQVRKHPVAEATARLAVGAPTEAATAIDADVIIVETIAAKTSTIKRGSTPANGTIRAANVNAIARSLPCFNRPDDNLPNTIS